MRRPDATSVIVTKPVGVNCNGLTVHGGIRSAVGGGKCGGTMMRKDLSRLEEGLGHEGFACTACGRRVKYVPPRAPK